MPSTYSSLKIELIGTGDQAGTWGNTTNVNLGTAIQEAITGNATVTFASSNAAIALTDTNATQTARNLRLILDGTISTTQTLFVPAITKQYLVTNNLTSPVVISNGTNASPTGTTVTVPAGKSMIVFNNGTNIAEATNYITEFAAANITVTSAVNAASANLTGTLTASNVTVTNNVNAATLNLTNALSITNGGTNRSNLTYGSVLVGNNTGIVTLVAPGGSGNLLTSNGTHWISQAAGSAGNVSGPGTSVDNEIVLFSGTGGNVLKRASTTGVLKAASGVINSAVAGTDYVAPNVATTFTATQTFSGSTSTFGAILNDVAEVATVVATAATGTINVDVTTQSVLYYTSNASANWTVNLRASSGTALNTALSSNQAITIAFLVTQGGTAYYNSNVQVDGVAITPKWQGGTAPTAGNASGVDSYLYTVVKSGTGSLTVFASQTQFK